MKDMRKIVLLAAAFLLYNVAFCGDGAVPPRKDAGALALEKLMKDLAPKATMFGHQDDMSYGLGWRAIPWESDVKRVTGSYPAVFGWDLGKIGNPVNLDSVPFDSMKVYIRRAHEMGGINTLSWHAYLPTDSTTPWTTKEKVVVNLLPGGKDHAAFKHQLDLVADFIGNLKDGKGNMIPVLFRPWHEMDGSWFWWGANNCTTDEYKQLYRFTIEYLWKTKHVCNMIVGYSPDRNFANADEYYRFYPGDDIVDLLGVDNYWDMKFSGDSLNIPTKKVEFLVDEAKKKGKIAAMTETGLEGLPDIKWYTEHLDKVISANEKTKQLSYILVWRNFSKSHHYAPYPGEAAVPDFLEWVNKPDIWLLNDLKAYRGIK